MKALVVLLALGLLIYAVLDCSRAPDNQIPSGMPRPGWLLLIVLLPILGPIFWIVASHTETDPRGPRASGSSRSPKAPSGPDDDPDFLRGL